eukprot:GILJ01005668.1.p1 GENE.GILJ01005668.1~~GILJ01005668.1.p1  ORF type:complete len:208 (-),score=7.74 GILJ01005668.1:180-803(-)
MMSHFLKPLQSFCCGCDLQTGTTCVAALDIVNCALLFLGAVGIMVYGAGYLAVVTGLISFVSLVMACIGIVGAQNYKTRELFWFYVWGFVQIAYLVLNSFVNWMSSESFCREAVADPDLHDDMNSCERRVALSSIMLLIWALCIRTYFQWAVWSLYYKLTMTAAPGLAASEELFGYHGMQDLEGSGYIPLRPHQKRNSSVTVADSTL